MKFDICEPIFDDDGKFIDEWIKVEIIPIINPELNKAHKIMLHNITLPINERFKHKELKDGNANT